MKAIRQILVMVLFFLVAGFSSAQEVYIPKTYSLEDKNDYQSHRGTVEKCLQWLLETPLHENTETRGEANAFVMQWIAGSPTVTIETQSELFPFAEKNKELFYTFVHALTLYHLQNEEILENDDTIYALKEVVKMYRQSKGLEKDDAIKELRKARRWGKLDEWIYEQMK